MDRTNKAMIVISSLEFDSYVITKIKKVAPELLQWMFLEPLCRPTVLVVRHMSSGDVLKLPHHPNKTLSSFYHH